MDLTEASERGVFWSRILRAGAGGLTLAVVQIVLACVVATYDGDTSPLQKPSLLLRVSLDPSDLRNAYLRLVPSESLDRSVAEHGYREQVVQRDRHGNLGVFPGYPLAVRGMYHALAPLGGRDAWVEAERWPLSMLLTAHFASCGFWFYLLLLLDRCRVPFAASLFATLLLGAQPGAMFLVTATADSLFLFTLLGFVYWCDAEHPALKWIGVAHGIVMTATQFLALPLVLYPVIRGFLRPGAEGRIFRVVGGVILALASSAGAIAFFVYGQQQFGEWEIHLRSRYEGWPLRPNFHALLERSTYTFSRDGLLADGFLAPDWLGKIAVPIFVVAFALVFLVELSLVFARPHSSTLRERAGYFLLALLLFYATSAELYGNQYRSMIRHLFGTEALLILHLSHLANNEDLGEGGGWLWTLLVWSLILASLLVQIAYLHQFTHSLMSI